MEALPNYGLANTITGFATLFAGLTCLGLCWLVRPQPRHWHFAYWMIAVTGAFTVTLHGFGETTQGPGPRWFWAFLDTGSNIVVAWAIALAVLADYYDERLRRIGRFVLTSAMVIGVLWHFYDRLPSTDRSFLIPLGEWGGFHPGETWLIALSFTICGLLIARRSVIPVDARRILLVVFAVFFSGMLLATASNDKIVPPFLAMHALWHVVGAFGFILLWAFVHVSHVHGRDER
jgi:hypothetical protein